MSGPAFTADDFLNRATGERTFDANRVVSAGKMYQLAEQPWWIWANFHAPQKEKQKTDTPWDRYLMQLGQEFGEETARTLYPEARAISTRPWEERSLTATIEAMMQGAEAITEGTLWDLETEVYGAADILVRSDDHTSDFGDYHYRVIEVKQSSEVKDYAVLQAGLYNRILGRIQGYTPPEFEILLEDGSRNAVSRKDTDGELDRKLDLLRKLRDEDNEPARPGHGAGKDPWGKYCDQLLEEDLDVVLLPGVGPGKRSDFLEAFGTASIRDLFGKSVDEFVDAFGPDRGVRTWAHVEAYRRNAPVPIPGTTLDIPHPARRLYYDFENTTPDFEEMDKHVYMIGVYDPDRDDFQCLTTRGAADEKKMFEDFRALVGDIESVRLFHWHSHETGVMRNQVAVRHPELSPILQELIRASIDLKEVIKSAIALPVPTYSIKSVAPLAGFNWSQDDVDGMSSQLYYAETVRTGDPAPLDKVIQYNREDCVSMWKVQEWVEGRD